MEDLVISKEKVGSGAYGSVYKGTMIKDGREKTVAVKQCKLKSTAKNTPGIPELTEALVMSSISHSNINRGLEIFTDRSYLNMVQELADTDLNKYCKENTPSESVLKKWCWQMLCAVHHLHKEGYIHGDIKPANMLLYGDTVKLTDFSHTVKKFYSRYHHSTGTMRYIPIEYFFESGWNEKIDIWALGCSFYEIAFGKPLFPSQRLLDKDGKPRKDEEAVSLAQKKHINALLSWGPYKEVRKYKVAYAGVEEDSRLAKMKKFSNLIYRMLRVDDKDRPSAADLLEDPYFEGCNYINGVTWVIPKHSLSPRDEAWINKYVRSKELVIDRKNYITEDIMGAIKRLYWRARKKLSDELCDKNILLGVMWIIHKIANRSVPLLTETEMDVAIEVERIICNHEDIKYVVL